MSDDRSQNTNNTIRPAILLSRCVGFEHCRWNGEMIASPYVEKLKHYVDFVTVCPESDIGLGIPRKPVRLAEAGTQTVMVQHTSGLNVTAEMNTFSANFLSALQAVDGFLYKERSPSCGVSNVKIYADTQEGSAVRRMGNGLFGAAFKSTFPLLPIASEGHLYNYMLREHFFTQIYTLARFRSIRAFPAITNLVTFHANHKLILMSYHQTIMRKLGKLAANHEHRNAETVFDEYGKLLCTALARPPRITSPINVLMHAMGYFSEKVTSNEKKFFLDLLEQYRQKKIPLSTCNAVVKSWIVRFDEKYLAAQLFFSPYPEALVELSDSGK
jgi:uncharacterized protein YbgA (DUF1722 family)/uncharacterized protein YbbK (DUF523 family)